VSASRTPRGLPRPLEAALAVGGLAAAAPVLALSGVLVKLSSPGPVLFRQERMGQDGKPFRLYKFRTMRAGNSGPAITARGDARITPIGKILRQTKLDELPSLLNVAKGELSFVGPRPEVPRYVDLSDPLWRAVLSAKPGLTSQVTIELRNEEQLLAAVSGDRDRYYREYLLPYKLLGERDYVEARSWRTDLGVIAQTLVAIVRSDRVVPPTLQDVEARVRAHQQAPGA
jgi:lipopolysaccharide/colanic/teichoic acid biosynthesis glycosyltransferase